MAVLLEDSRVLVLSAFERAALVSALRTAIFSARPEAVILERWRELLKVLA